MGTGRPRDSAIPASRAPCARDQSAARIPSPAAVRAARRSCRESRTYRRSFAPALTIHEGELEMKTIRTVSLTADITRKIQDWTRLLAQNAPAPEFVSDFHILSLSSHTVCARISYGRHGAAKLELYRFRESADDPDRGHMMTYTPPSGPPRTVYSEPITEIVGYDDDDY